MISSASQDQKSFSFFLFLVLLTGLSAFLLSDHTLLVGVLAVIWGFFGFFRLIYLSHYQNNDIPKFLNLPIQILFGSSKREQQKRKLILQRMAQPDVLLWLVGIIIFIIRMAYYQLYIAIPDEASVRTSYIMLTQLSLYGVVVTMIFVGLSYSQKRENIKKVVFFLGPVILISFTMAIIQSYNMTVPQSSYWGLRYDAIGLIGAYGLYILGLPAVAMFTKVLLKGRRTFLKPFIGLVSLVMLLVLDRLIVGSDWALMCSLLLFCSTSILWGHTVRYRL